MHHTSYERIEVLLWLALHLVEKFARCAAREAKSPMRGAGHIQVAADAHDDLGGDVKGFFDILDGQERLCPA